MPEDTRLTLTTKELLQRTGLSRSSLYNLIKAKRITPLNVTKSNRLFKMSDIETLLNLK